MLLAGKLASWGVIGAIHPGKLVHVKDDISGASFLVDTGSSFSILPYSSSLPPTGPLLKSAGGQRIPCWGRRRLTVSFNGRRYSWNFLLAAVEFRILGVDFLQKIPNYWWTLLPAACVDLLHLHLLPPLWFLGQPRRPAFIHPPPGRLHS